MRPAALYLLFGLFIIQPFSASALGHDYINDIAVRTLNLRLSHQEIEDLNLGSDTIANKNKFIDSVFVHEEFIAQIVLVMRFQIMKGCTYEDVYRQMEQLDVLLLMLPLEMDDEKEKAMYEAERLRMQNIYGMTQDYLQGEITFQDIYKRMFDNFIYDKQNMGVENFVFSTFQYALGRKPTESEFRQARAMYYNTTGYLFFKEGKSKADYLDILTSSDNFLEYQIQYWHYFFALEFPDIHLVHDILAQLKKEHKTVTVEDIIRHILIYNL